MKFLDKLGSLLSEVGSKEANVFIQWVIKQAQLTCDADAIMTSADQTHDQVLFDVSQLSETDLKKLESFFKLPENALPTKSISISDHFLCNEILPQFKEYIKNLVTDTAEEHISNPMKSSEVEIDEDDFVIVESSGNSGNVDLENYPWLDPSHPLYFPPTQPSTTSTLTRWEAMDKFSVENWYYHLKKHTFETCFVTLDYEDIQFLTGHVSSTYDSKKLIQTFDSILSQLNNQEAFMRLSTRSPKDSKNLFDEAATIMSKDDFYWKETDNKNQQLVSFVASMTKSMKITSGQKIIETIQGSPRVQNDLMALLSMSSPSKGTTNIALREWYNIRPDHEFRVFVSRRSRKESIVTAISQYFHFLYFDKAPEECFNFLDETSKSSIIKKFQNYVLKLIDPEVAKFLNFSSEQDDDDSINCIREYIVDLALIPISQYHGDVTDENKIDIGGRIYIIMVIELNPFAPSATGCALFNWKTDLNMLWGKTPSESPVVSFRTQPREDLSSVTLLPANYEQVIQNALSKRLALSPSSSEIQVSSERVSSTMGSAHKEHRFFVPEQSRATSSVTAVDDTTNLSF